MKIEFYPMRTDEARGYQAGGPDAYGLVPEPRISDGVGVPCRHCLRIVPAGAGYLVLAHRPFAALQPYAETGPVFLCATPCDAAVPGVDLPECLDSLTYILRGYGADDRIVYGTGRVVPTVYLAVAAQALLAMHGVSYAHVRSAANNCYQVGIRPGPA